MKKFFLFRKENVTISSVPVSDQGVGISVLALPADSMSFMSASKGMVFIAFNDATVYEESNLTDGESFEKTTVKIPCEEGQEVGLMESILAFIARDGGASIMRFDAVDKDSTFSRVSFDDKIQSHVHVNPIKRITGKISTQTFLGTTGSVGADVVDNTIGGIDFRIEENKPAIDYNHEGLSQKANGSEINSWENAGTGGNTYNIGANVGAPIVSDPAVSASYLSKKSAKCDTNSYFIVPTYSTPNDYTLYFAITQTRNDAHPFYGDGDGICFGYNLGQFKEDEVNPGEIAKIRPMHFGNFAVRHASRIGAAAISQVSDDSNGTTPFKYPNYEGDVYDRILVFVIRRDVEGNMYMYNKLGEFVSFIAARTASTLLKDGIKYTDATDHRTDGDLKIERLGTINDITTNAFGGSIARFGVIPRDIGTSSCIKLAEDLYNLYKI